MSHRWLLTLAILVVAIVLAGIDVSAAKRQSAHDKFYEHAIELIAKGDHNGAIIELKNALQADPKDIAARVLLGNTYLEVENGASAAKEFLRARRDGARNSFILAPLARAYILQGLYKKALKELDTAGQNQTAAAELAMLRGDAHLARLSFAKAEASYLEASKMRPNDARPLVGLARVKLANDDMPGARNYIKWALEADSSNPRAWYIQGEVADLNGDAAEALKNYDRAIELAPEFPSALLARAAINIDRGRHHDAEPDIELVRKTNPRNPRAAYLLSLILAQRGEVKAARKLLGETEEILKSYPASYMLSHPPSLLLAGVVTYFRGDIESSHRLLRLFLKRVPHHPGARKLLASVSLKWNEPKVAIQYLDPLGPRDTDDIDILIMYGDALARLKRFREASSILKRAENLVEPGSSSLFKLVATQLQSGQGSEAIRILKSEIDRDPNAVQAAIMLGTAQLKSGDFQAALKTLNSITERQPDNAVAHNLAGGAHLGLGEVEAARRSYQAAIDAKPNYLGAAKNLAKVEMGVGNLDRAAELFSGILESDSRNGDAMISLAEISRLRDDVNESIRWLEKARSSSRSSREAALRLVDLYIGSSRAEDALFVARQLFDAHPNEFDTMLAFGRAQLAVKKLEEAVATFRNFAGLAEEKKSAARLHQAATWQLRARDKNGARQSLQKAVEIDGRHMPSHMLLFHSEMAAGNLGAALVRARKLVSFNSTSPVGHMLIGDVHQRRQSYDAAISAYEEALRLEESADLAFRVYYARRAADQGGFEFAKAWADKRPDDPSSQLLLATAYADAGRLSGAIEIYESLLQKAPDDTRLLNNVALFYQRAGDSRAIEYAKRAYDAAPTSVTMDTYGWILVRQGRIDEGLALLRNAILLAPGVAEIRYHLAVALNAKGQTEAARKELREALRTGRPFEGRDEARVLWKKLAPARQ